MFTIMSKSVLAVSNAVVSRTAVPAFPSSLSSSTTTTRTTRWMAVVSVTIPRSQQATTTTTTTGTASTATTTAVGSLDAFRDAEPREKRARETVGRSWTVKELRRKSFEDCHKLWYVPFRLRSVFVIGVARDFGILFGGCFPACDVRFVGLERQAHQACSVINSVVILLNMNYSLPSPLTIESSKVCSVQGTQYALDGKAFGATSFPDHASTRTTPKGKEKYGSHSTRPWREKEGKVGCRGTPTQ
jgi:hypothetical protein